MASRHQIVALLPADAARSRQIDQLRTDGVALRVHPSPMSLPERIWQRIAPSSVTGTAHNAFASVIREVTPDLIVVSSGGLFPGAAAATAVLDSKIPYVNIANAAHVDWAPDDQSASTLREYATQSFSMFFVSDQNRLDCETQLSKRLPNARLIRNPYLVGHDAALPWPADDNRAILKIACVARLFYPAKGQDLLLEALARPEWRNRSWSLSFFGTGPQAETIRRLGNMHGIDERLSFRGHVSDVEGIWRDHHVLVLPSRYEGLPIAIVEAMLCGRPVLAGDVGGARELVVQGQTGFLCAPNSIEALAGALEQLWGMRDMLQALGDNARTKAMGFAPPDPIADFIDELTRVSGFDL
ncbi:glycosyltransferase [Bosea sp. 124]|uniref:glycosyltransferase n=1 Tax=Bosea sp. 124 TaxID=2135642 RepID=UPI001AECECD3|nr:glycosyltransferase [Bosea sp. 124]